MKLPLLVNLLLGGIVGWQNPNIHPNSVGFPLSPPAKNWEKQVNSNRKTCQISAYVIDKDPQGLNVRSSANTNSEILGKLPTNKDAVFVDIAASQGNWVEINKAEDASGTAVFQGKGWVYASKLGTSTRGYSKKSVSVYANTNKGSKKIGSIPSQTQVKLLNCDGKWAYVSYQRLQGWLAVDDQCPNPLTTCP